MANIKDCLAKILSAVHGKDVRKAIHDSIYQCYKDGRAGAVDLVARNQIEELANTVVAPAMVADGTEYKTAELYDNKPVYARLVRKYSGDPGGVNEVLGSTFMMDSPPTIVSLSAICAVPDGRTWPYPGITEVTNGDWGDDDTWQGESTYVPNVRLSAAYDAELGELAVGCQTCVILKPNTRIDILVKYTK